MRKATITRTTKETNVEVTVNLDGTGIYDINLEIGFLKHMLEQLSRHSSIDITINASGDTHIDYHHLTEDIAICLGLAIKKALNDRKGINRFGEATIPMDDALSQCAIDLSGRPYLIWNVNLTVSKLGDFDTELFQDWFYALAVNCGCNLHINNLYGNNNHHIIESCYKALARSLRVAISYDEKQIDAIPSTKGTLSNT